jgi:hypothetical protein
VRSLGSVDLQSYLRAFALLFRNPQIALGPLLAAVANVFLLSAVPQDGGFLGYANASILGIVSFLIDASGLALAIVSADAAWRYGRAPLSEAYGEARRRAGDILVAAIGFAFLVSVAGIVGGTLGGPGAIVLSIAAYVLCIYMLPAAAIGGIPGGASLQVSAERVRNSPLAAILIAALFFVGTRLGPPLLVEALQPLLLGGAFFENGLVLSLLVAVVRAIFTGYVALVVAKAYGDASYGRFRRW